MKLLFAGERKVCDKIFEGFDSLSEQCKKQEIPEKIICTFGHVWNNARTSFRGMAFDMQNHESSAISLVYWFHKFASIINMWRVT